MCCLQAAPDLNPAWSLPQYRHSRPTWTLAPRYSSRPSRSTRYSWSGTKNPWHLAMWSRQPCTRCSLRRSLRTSSSRAAIPPENWKACASPLLNWKGVACTLNWKGLLAATDTGFSSASCAWLLGGWGDFALSSAANWKGWAPGLLNWKGAEGEEVEVVAGAGGGGGGVQAAAAGGGGGGEGGGPAAAAVPPALLEEGFLGCPPAAS
mmetsp:Transcript_8837/g.13603  ORF Transcript_8837/g.13603 Transcript_8837/m.13603 type:complete len:207 (-) Transcript_8837:144-764(-)